MDKPICNPENIQLDEAVGLLLKFLKLAMQTNHLGKNKDCPQCHLVLEAIDFCKKYYSIDSVPEEYREEVEKAMQDVKDNPRKFIFS